MSGPLDIWSEHPLIAAWLAILFLLVVLLGGLHVSRLFIGCLTLFAREFKHELQGGWKALKQLKAELTSWKSDP